MSVFEDLDRESDAPRMADLWAWARDDYLAGETADIVCERHGLSRSQFFERARREGWRRSDLPRSGGPPAYDAEAEAEAIEAALLLPPAPVAGLHRRAWAQAERAILAGRRVEAQGWVRLARDLQKLSREEGPDSPDCVASPKPMRPAPEPRRAPQPPPRSPQAPPPPSAAAPDAAPARPPPNRRARRAQAKRLRQGGGLPEKPGSGFREPSPMG